MTPHLVGVVEGALKTAAITIEAKIAEFSNIVI
jgi:hypothetical protein